TNRPDLLEPALAARPGRIDQAIEVPLPDAEGRRRLLERYARGLDLGDVDVERVVERTKGASGAFIRELLRKAAVFAADEAPHEGRDGRIVLSSGGATSRMSSTSWWSKAGISRRSCSAHTAR
ncbi:MAG: hypothetical protein ACRDM9_14090, partial [Gaiellaceae bacterium]